MSKKTAIVEASEQRFDQYVERLLEAVGHADRAEPLRSYCTGLMLPGERKSVEPMAARLEPHNVRSKHQSNASLYRRRTVGR